ncbi:hypothetical protein [Methanolobus halotolerans]|uniref:Uncharacterized protein n=1 Tax=Methanolobus halotolerans TaxID=2052935 RepID=A0A4E0PXI2_9EURY|nr:hypothetical protein [Methanolobus halotolerans]TGC09462.1 hypothetical protein CUN85_06435 [Methanolobus halotolerans]
MKLKTPIPKGVIALVSVLPALNKNADLQSIHAVLVEIIQFGESVSSNGKDAKNFYDSSTKEFDVDSIFGKWAESKLSDTSRKIAREVCLIIKREMFE